MGEPVASPPFVGTAPAKLILMGEHFVVHGTRALAIPVESLALEVWLNPGAPPEGQGIDPGSHLEACLAIACTCIGLAPFRIAFVIALCLRLCVLL